MRLTLTVGYRVLVCDNMAFHRDFTPVLAKHTKHLSFADILSVNWTGVEIKWPQPSGLVQRLNNPPIDRYVTIVEGQDFRG